MGFISKSPDIPGPHNTLLFVSLCPFRDLHTLQCRYTHFSRYDIISFRQVLPSNCHILMSFQFLRHKLPHPIRCSSSFSKSLLFFTDFLFHCCSYSAIQHYLHPTPCSNHNCLYYISMYTYYVIIIVVQFNSIQYDLFKQQFNKQYHSRPCEHAVHTMLLEGNTSEVKH